MEDTEEVSKTKLKGILYAASIIYGVVTGYIGLAMFDGFVQTVTLIVALVGTIATYVILKKTYESQYEIKL